jgi:hypothetical protein
LLALDPSLCILEDGFHLGKILEVEVEVIDISSSIGFCLSICLSKCYPNTAVILFPRAQCGFNHVPAYLIGHSGYLAEIVQDFTANRAVPYIFLESHASPPEKWLGSRPSTDARSYFSGNNQSALLL